jgi:predicted lysophospholipase L1 biosynthesis ABC-type transport system permease subunit
MSITKSEQRAAEAILRNKLGKTDAEILELRKLYGHCDPDAYPDGMGILTLVLLFAAVGLAVYLLLRMVQPEFVMRQVAKPEGMEPLTEFCRIRAAVISALVGLLAALVLHLYSCY